MSTVFSQIASDAFEKMQFKAGMVLNTFDPQAPKKPEDAAIVCATTGGITASCVATYSDMGSDVDNCPRGTKEMKVLDSWDCKMSFTALDISTAMLKLSLGAATVGGNKVTPKMDLEETDFADEIWWVGDLIGGGWAAVCLKNVLSSGGLSIKTTNDGKGNLSVELQGHFSINSQDEVPMEFYASVDAVA